MLLLNRKVGQRLHINELDLIITKLYQNNGQNIVDVVIENEGKKEFKFIACSPQSTVVFDAGENVEVKFLSIGDITIRLGITAPKTVNITREEAIVKTHHDIK